MLSRSRSAERAHAADRWRMAGARLTCSYNAAKRWRGERERFMLVLGIETSCDETGIALYDSEAGLLANMLYSQAASHADYGGVVPELASRDHIRKAVPLVREALRSSGRAIQDIDGVAYTAGPGLPGALMVGASIGRALAWSLGRPSIGVHHMEAHLLAPLMDERRPGLPFVALLVSGGHTQLVKTAGVGRYELLGESLDDAAGEAFDKTARLLGLGYPGGPAIAARAAAGRPGRFAFPRPMTDRPGLEFSFSGLKTHVANVVRNLQPPSAQDVADIAWAFQDAVVDTLAIKCQRALEAAEVHELVIAGGVAANQALRERLEAVLPAVYYAPPALCTDNGAMVAYAGYLRLAADAGPATAQSAPGEAPLAERLAIETRARWSLQELPPA